MKRFALLLAILGMAAVFTACGSASYSDGTYTGKSSVYEGDEEGNADGYGEVSITITNGVISDCDFKTYEKNGTLKDSEYGKEGGEIANKDYYNKAQKAVMANSEYAKRLEASGNIKDVDAVSGATISYGQFKEAVADALSQAEQ